MRGRVPRLEIEIFGLRGLRIGLRGGLRGPEIVGQLKFGTVLCDLYISF